MMIRASGNSAPDRDDSVNTTYIRQPEIHQGDVRAMRSGAVECPPWQ